MDSLIHPKSQITPLGDFDLFVVPPTQKTVERDILHEYRPLAAISSSSNILQFNIPSVYNEYIRLNDMLFYIKLRVDLEKTSNVDASDWGKIFPVNNFMHSIFKQIDMEIDNKSVCPAPQTYSYKAYFENLLGYTDDAKNSHLIAEGWFPKTFKVNGTKVEKDDLLRKDFLMPSTVSTDGKGKTIELMGKLHFDLSMQPKALLGGAVLKVSLIPNDPSFYLICSGDDLKPKVTFESVSLYVHKSKVEKDVYEAHNLALEEFTAKYLLPRNSLRAINVPDKIMDVFVDHAVTGQIPRRMFIAMVSNEAFSGNLKTDPFKFDHFNIIYLAAFVDGTQSPPRAFKPDFTNKLYLKSYIAFKECLDELSTDGICTLAPNEWAETPIFGFSLAPDSPGQHCSKSGYLNPLIKNGVIRLELRFSAALSKPITVLIFSEFDNLLQIDKDRQPFIDWI